MTILAHRCKPRLTDEPAYVGNLRKDRSDGTPGLGVQLISGNGAILAVPAAGESAPKVSVVVQPGTPKAKTIPLHRVVTLIGSRSGCKLNLPNKRVSPVHVAIVNDGSDVFAVDLVSKIGTKLNGLKMEHEKLGDGDLLTVGPWELRVRIEQDEEAGDKDLNAFGLEPSPQVIALEHVATQRILQPSRPVVVIGRRHGCDVVLSETSVSRSHALLFCYYGRPAIFDLLSQNHTLVNDAPVAFTVLKDSDIVTIGDSQFRIRIAESSVGRRPSASSSPTVPQPLALMPAEPGDDLIDIEITEGAQSWKIADDLAKVARKG